MLDRLLGTERLVKGDRKRFRMYANFVVAGSIVLLALPICPWAVGIGFNFGTALGLVLSALIGLWSYKIGLIQKAQESDLDSMLAGRQKFCTSLDEALRKLIQVIDLDPKSANIVAARNRRIEFHLYLSSFALGAISDDETLELFKNFLNKIYAFVQAPGETNGVNLHLYVWHLDDHRKYFSKEKGIYKDLVKSNWSKIQEVVAIYDKILATFKDSRFEGDVYLHETPEDNLRFFCITTDAMVIQASMILMTPKFGLHANGQRDQDTTAPSLTPPLPDLSCMMLWDGTHQGRTKLWKYLSHYSEHCCDNPQTGDKRCVKGTAARNGDMLRDKRATFIESFFQ